MTLDEIDTPAVIIDLDRLERNLSRAQDYCNLHGIALRPHMKTHKIPEIGRMQVELGAVGLTCAKLGEAEVMAGAGIEDLFIAYPIWGAAKLERLMALARRSRITTAFDSPEVAEAISAAALAAGLKIPCLVEVNTGMGRCGVEVGEPLKSLAALTVGLGGLDPIGLMTYQGHIGAGGEGAMKFESTRIEQAVALAAEAGVECRVVSGGTSPALFSTHLAPAITEARAGTYVFNDRNMVGAGAAQWDDCAMSLLVTVVSTAVAGQMIVDGGSKTFHSDRAIAFEGYGRFMEDPGLVLTRMNEEHGYVDTNNAERAHSIGDRLRVIPNHVCVAMNMHDEAWVCRGEQVVDRWTIAARGKVR